MNTRVRWARPFLKWLKISVFSLGLLALASAQLVIAWDSSQGPQAEIATRPTPASQATTMALGAGADRLLPESPQSAADLPVPVAEYSTQSLLALILEAASGLLGLLLLIAAASHSQQRKANW